jgi:tRNA dimethylallyltransferase
MDAGALKEARSNLPGWTPGRPSARAIGGPELIAHLQGRIGRAEAIDAAVVASRQYAKRQRTWFRSNMAEWTRVSFP